VRATSAARAQRSADLAGPGTRAVDHPLIDEAQDIAALKAKILASGLSISQLVTTAWASAATFRGSDKRGGANGAAFAWRRRRTGRSTSRPSWRRCCQLEAIQRTFNGAQSGGKKVSLADLIVLGGCAAVEAAAKKAGHDVQVPFSPGRTDASQEQTDVESFAVLEPIGRLPQLRPQGLRGIVPAELLVDKAQLADADRARDDGSDRRPARAERKLRAVAARRLHRAARNVDQRLLHESARHAHDSGRSRCKRWGVLEGATARPARLNGQAPVVDLVFGSNSQLRALAEVYACADSQEKFVRDFVAAWNKVMNLDRFDLA
jgi:catalase-peroxidase